MKQDTAERLLRSIEAEPENPNEEFTFGTFTAGFVAGQTQRSAGFGLLFAWDNEEPEPGFQLIIGPISFWWRRNFPFTVSVLQFILYPERKTRG